MLRREDGLVLTMALDMAGWGQRKKGRPRKKQVDEESVKVGLRREDARCRSKWSVGVHQIADWLRWMPPPSIVAGTTRSLTLVSLFLTNSDVCLSRVY